MEVNHISIIVYLTPLFFPATVDEAKELLWHGADVNHRARLHGETALFHAIWRLQRDVVECLISSGADVNVFTRAGKPIDYLEKYTDCSFTPLQEALRSFVQMSKLKHSRAESRQAPVQRIENYFDIVKLMVPLCDVFSFIVTSLATVPCVVHFFRAESKYGWEDLIVTKYLLRHGARAKFYRFYDCIFKCNFEIKPFSKAFLKLVILSGCKFDRYFYELKSILRRRLHVKPLLS